MTTDKRDDWDDHWSHVNDITEKNPAQHYRHKLIVDIVHDYVVRNPNIKEIVDFGSGQGDVMALLTKKITGVNFYGLELSQVGVDISKQKCPNTPFYKINLLDSNDTVPELFGIANLGLCSEVLEHLDDPKQMLEEIKRYLAPRAFLIVTVPSGPMNAFEKFIGHRQHFTKETISNLTQSAGFMPVQTIRAGFPFFNLYKIAGYLQSARVVEKITHENSKDFKQSITRSILLATLAIFRFLFRFNLKDNPLGWQLIHICQYNP